MNPLEEQTRATVGKAMTNLEDLLPIVNGRGNLPNTAVQVVSVTWFGEQAVELTYKDETGKFANQCLDRDFEPTLSTVKPGRPWSFEGDGATLRLVSESIQNETRDAMVGFGLEHPGRGCRGDFHVPVGRRSWGAPSNQ